VQATWERGRVHGAMEAMEVLLRTSDVLNPVEKEGSETETDDEEFVLVYLKNMIKS